MHQRNLLLAATCITLGWGLLAVWADLLGHMPALSTPYSALSPLGNMRIYWLAGLLAASIGLAAFSYRIERIRTVLDFATPLLASFGTLAFSISFQQTLFSSEAMALTGIVAAGAAYTWLSCGFCITLTRTQDPAVATACVIGSLVVKIVLFQVASVVFDDSAETIIAVALPLFIAALAYGAKILLAKSLDNCCESDPSLRVQQRGSLKDTLCSNAKMWLLPQVVVAAIALATVRAITPLGFFGDPLELFENTPESVLGAIGVAVITIALSAILFVRKPSGRNATDFLPGFLVIILAFFASTGINPGNEITSALLEMFITAAEAFSHILFWLVLMTAIRIGDASSYRFAGIATGLYNAFSLILIAFFFDLGIANNAIILCVMFAILLLVIWLADRKSDRTAMGTEKSEGTGSSIEEADAKPTDKPADRREQLADEYGLSPREREVFMMLAQGRSRAHISKTLVLSEGTVKTHVSHIYSKLGVSSKQEMIDLLLDDDQSHSA